MSEAGVALLILVALAAGVVVGQRVRMGKPRGARAAGTGANGAAPHTFGVPVARQIAAACGCS
jgi:hypothetical protein